MPSALNSGSGTWGGGTIGTEESSLDSLGFHVSHQNLRGPPEACLGMSVLLGPAPVPPTPTCPCLGLHTCPSSGWKPTNSPNTGFLFPPPIVILPPFGKLLIILQSPAEYHLLFSAHSKQRKCGGRGVVLQGGFLRPNEAGNGFVSDKADQLPSNYG